MPKCVVMKGDATNGDLVVYWCPGCRSRHSVRVQKSAGIPSPSWEWNGSLDNPTITPSVHYTPGRCHHFVQDGWINYCGDCSDHSLGGKVVRLSDVDADGVLAGALYEPLSDADAEAFRRGEHARLLQSIVVKPQPDTES